MEIDNGESVSSITGDTQKPFGSTKLIVVEIVSLLVQANKARINSKISESGILKKLLQFYGDYQWNNLLHYKLGVIFSTILATHNSELQLSLFTQAHFISYVASLL